MQQCPLKHRPEFPDRFGCFEDAHGFCTRFFGWYNDEHRHSGIGFHTPADVHHGRAEQVRAERAVVLDTAYAAHPERFVRKPPAPPKLPTIAWINQPEENHSAQRIPDQPVSQRLTPSGRGLHRVAGVEQRERLAAAPPLEQVGVVRAIRIA
jgi:hypothetical protein